MTTNQQINMNQKKLRNKFIFIVVVVLSITMGFSLYLYHQTQVKNYRDQLEVRGKSLGDFIALTSSDALLGQDYLLMNQYMKEITHQPDVVYGVILSAEGNNLTSYLDHENKIITDAYDDEILKTIKNINKLPDVFTMTFPMGTDHRIGSIVLGFSTKNIDTISQAA